jgi:uncharacterized alpha-E superfamily protein
MLSRVADAIYWMGRYVERAENITRLLLVTEDFSTETQGLEESVAQAAWKDLLAMLPTAQLTRPVSAFAPLSLPYLTSFFLDAQNAYSIHFSLRKARENARSVREALTVEAFMSINETFRAVEGYARKGLTDLPGLRDALASTHKGIFSVIGAIDSTFTRDEGWHFLKLGESVERIYRAGLILRARLPALLASEPRTDVPLYYSQWRSLLRSLSSLENYRKAHGARLEPDLVVAFLFFDAMSPRSLRAGTATIKECLERVAGGADLTPAARLVGKLHADLCYADTTALGRAEVPAVLDGVVDAVTRAHEALTAQYFVT